MSTQALSQRSITAPDRCSAIGRILLGLGILASGIQQITTGHFVRLVPGSVQMPSSLPYVVGGILIVSGAMILFQIRTRLAAGGFGTLLFASFCFQHVPLIVAQPQLGYVWTNPLKALALVGSMLVLIAGAENHAALESTIALRKRCMLMAVGRISLAIFLLACGTQHFAYADFAASLVPEWLPGHKGWTYFTGVALLAGGAGLLFPRRVRIAGILTGMMIFLWVILLHIPRALADLGRADEMSSVFEAIALSGAAFLAAGTAPRCIEKPVTA